MGSGVQCSQIQSNSCDVALSVSVRVRHATVNLLPWQRGRDVGSNFLRVETIGLQAAFIECDSSSAIRLTGHCIAR